MKTNILLLAKTFPAKHPRHGQPTEFRQSIQNTLDFVRKEGNRLLSGCGINLGYKCNGGKGFACDRFHWWNMEQRVGMTHYEYMLKQATESDKETMDIQ